jgi:Vacuolar sorting 38 and autophagy-related subunit 14
LSISPHPDGEALSALSSTIARARSGLVQELVEVFNVVQVGGRPPIGGKAGTKGEWTIGDLILPVPGDMRRNSFFVIFLVPLTNYRKGYPPDHMNAVLTHTIHFISLLTFYLGVKLPFEVVWTGGRLGVGQPWIGATKGSEVGGWAR